MEVWGGGEGGRNGLLVCEDWARVGGVYYWVVGGFGEGVGVFLFLGFLGFLVLVLLGCGGHGGGVLLVVVYWVVLCVWCAVCEKKATVSFYGINLVISSLVGVVVASSHAISVYVLYECAYIKHKHRVLCGDT